MIRNLILLFILIISVITAKGVPAYPNRVKVTVESGDTVEIFVKGDEFKKYAVSEDGYLLSQKNNKWYYINKNPEAGLTVSNIQLKKNVSKSIGNNLVRVDSMPAFPAHEERIVRHNRLAIYGDVSHALVILIEYPDKRFTKTKQEISNLFNQIGYDEDKAQGSVRDFYKYASYGTFDLISDIYGPYTTKSSMDFYGGNLSNGNDKNALELAIEAIQSLPDDVDLSIYDNNHDGIVDNIHIIFAGYGEEAGAASSTIWSHEYPHVLPITKNGYKIAGYSCTPELRSNMGTGITRIGVICHELGHAFGANDYYDVDYMNNGSFEGTGVWDIMASGSWNNNGISPANFNPYIKINDFGWVTPDVPETSGSILLSSYNFNPEVLKIPTSNPDDYYLIEYRTGLSFDKGLPGEGLLIYHVHPLIESRRISNTINNRHPQCFYPVCASSNESPFDTYSYGDINSAGCPFPGIANNTEFSDSSTPNAFQWNGNVPDISIKNIRISDEGAELDLFINSQHPSDQPIESLVYQESFENGLHNFFEESIEGRAEWSVYPTNSITTENDLPNPIEGKRALKLCDDNKSVIQSTSLLTSEGIALNSDSTYVMSYWMRIKELRPDGHHKLLLSIRNSISNMWDSVFETSESIDEWSEIQVPLPKDISNLCYQLSGEVLNSGIFIDDIKIKSIGYANTQLLDSEESGLSITKNPFCIVANSHLEVYIYDMAGKTINKLIMMPRSSITLQLPKGMYVVCTDKGDRYKVVI